MYDIKPLEEQWKRYKRKQRKPWYLFFFTVVMLIAASTIFYFNKTFLLEKFLQNDLNESKKIEKVITRKSDETLVPSSIFFDKAITQLQTVPKNIPTDDKTIVNREVSQPVGPYESAQDVSVLEESIDSDKSYGTQPVKVKDRPKIHLEIVETSSVSAYKDVENRFYQSHDIDDSLFLAKSYYRQGKYQQAEFWALQTNKVNPAIDESWLIFVKAKYKLGRKSEATNVLKTYINKSNSKEGKKLLEKFNNDGFID